MILENSMQEFLLVVDGLNVTCDKTLICFNSLRAVIE